MDIEVVRHLRNSRNNIPMVEIHGLDLRNSSKYLLGNILGYEVHNYQQDLHRNQQELDLAIGSMCIYTYQY